MACYLEDVLEELQELPDFPFYLELVRKLDIEIQEKRRKLEEKQEIFLSKTKDLPEDICNEEYELIKKESNQITELFNQKEEIVKKLYEKTKTFCRYLDSNIQKAEMELKSSSDNESPQQEIITLNNDQHEIIYNPDPNVKICYCQGIMSDMMVECCNKECLYGWFHNACLMESEQPRDLNNKDEIWFCPTCRKNQ